MAIYQKSAVLFSKRLLRQSENALFLLAAAHNHRLYSSRSVPELEENVLAGNLAAKPAPAKEDKDSRVKSIKEMPGPSTTSNLIEFFYRDGFSRIHEIQVRSIVFKVSVIYSLYPRRTVPCMPLKKETTSRFDESSTDNPFYNDSKYTELQTPFRRSSACR